MDDGIDAAGAVNLAPFSFFNLLSYAVVESIFQMEKLMPRDLKFS